MELETERLIMREMTHADLPSLCEIMKDENTMYAYEGAFRVCVHRRFKSVAA